jgi:single-strand DNA-binding protein
MANFNKVILAGNLTRDPELSYTASNTPVCKFGMAINRKWRDRNSNEMREETCFVDLTAFGRGGETINQYMSKGQPILIEGRLHYSQWESQDGGKRSKLEVIVDTFQFLGGGRSGQGGSGGGGQRRQAAPAHSGSGHSGGGYSGGGQGGAPADDYGPPVSDDDVPF